LVLISARIRAHLAGDDADVHVGVVDRVVRLAVGAVLGLALTLIVVVSNYMFYEAFTSDARQPDAVRRSISLNGRHVTSGSCADAAAFETSFHCATSPASLP
jgi:hypothetical protein